MEKKNKTQEINWSITISFVVAIIVVALFLESGIVNNVNNKNMHKTAQLLLNQVVDVIEKNEKSEQNLLASLKDDYMVRVKAVSYIIDAKPEAEYDVDELCKIAKLMSVDEIHLFDATGTIYSGSVPKYYGYNFDSGEQMAYFKPMLSDKSLTMCQDVTPNTSEKKKMMYAITWNDAGTRMVQVGIKPVRLLEELKRNKISTVVDNMPVYDGISIYVADAKTQKIYGATNTEDIGRKLKKAGISLQKNNDGTYQCTVPMQNGTKYSGIFEAHGAYLIGIRYERSINAKSSLTAVGIVGIYLGFAAVFILLMMVRLLRANQERDEQRIISNTDELTKCFNRRAYEEDIRRLDISKPFVYLSMDLNGLKKTNDTFGHAAGDELIRGAAACMKQCFGSSGKIYRIGGDEFAVILTGQVQELKQWKAEFETTVRDWRGEQITSMTISCGYVSSEEKTWESWEEIAQMADARMYDSKEAYYKEKGGKR